MAPSGRRGAQSREPGPAESGGALNQSASEVRELLAIHDLAIALGMPLGTRVSVRDVRAEVEEKPEQTTFLLSIDAVYVVGRPMIVGMGPAGEEQYRDALP